MGNRNSTNPYERLREAATEAEHLASTRPGEALAVLYLAKDDLAGTIKSMRDLRAESFTAPGLPFTVEG